VLGISEIKAAKTGREIFRSPLPIRVATAAAALLFSGFDIPIGGTMTS